MAVAIRLRREGNKNNPYYRIVVADSRSPRDGQFIELLGNYNPHGKGTNYTLDVAKAQEWVSKGARPSETVASLIKKAAAAAS
jgi:small subunit ribosomal protein S16